MRDGVVSDLSICIVTLGKLITEVDILCKRGYTGIVTDRTIAIRYCFMASFREIDIPSFLDTSAHDLTKDLFAPLFSQAVQYDRGVGFFSSGWLRTNGEEELPFLAFQAP